MKWLFAILVALNIIVFGGMLITRMAAPPQQQMAAQAPAAPQPTVVQIHTGPQTATPQEPAQAQPVTPPANHAAAPRAPAAPARRNDNNRNSSNTPAADKPPADSGIRAPSVACTDTAVLPEDDYHRIKGLLTRWPHSASRVVERRSGGNRQNTERYHVSVGIEGDIEEFTARLKSLGFSTSPAGGRMGIGTFNNEQQAERAAAKARQAGLTPQISRTGSSGSEHSAALGESKMQLTFINVDDTAAAGITGVIGRYSSLRRAACRR